MSGVSIAERPRPRPTAFGTRPPPRRPRRAPPPPPPPPATPERASASGGPGCSAPVLVTAPPSGSGALGPHLICDTHAPRASTSSQGLSGPTHRSPSDPQPGPSTSAAEFDLEVFDSGSSCSLEECWASVGSSAKEAGLAERKKYKSGGKRSRPKNLLAPVLVPSPVAASPELNLTHPNTDVVLCDLDEVVGDGGDSPETLPVHPLFAQALALHEAGPADSPSPVLAEVPPESACPSETDGEADDEGCLCTAACINVTPAHPVSGHAQPPDLIEDRRDVVDRWQCSSSSSSVAARSPPPLPVASTSKMPCNENIDAIVQDHDTFGTDENEDSLDSMSTSMDDLMSSSSPVDLPLSARPPLGRTLSIVNSSGETLSEMIELESCHPIKRKSSRIELGASDDGLSSVKKQCVLADFRAHGPTAFLDDEDTLPGHETGPPAASEAKPMSVDVDDIRSYPAGPHERNKLIPDKDNPPQDILNWVGTFGGWSHAERLLAIDQLIGACQPTQVRHMLAVIEPQFQRDFIFLLPKELSLYVLSFLSPRDLLRAAQTCRYWRILCEDNLLWREKCKEAGLLDHEFKETMRARARRSTEHCFPYSAWKSSFMRQHNIEMNWRVRPVRPPKVLKGHDDHVITCLQFNSNRIVSGSDDNTLKVWSAVTGKCLRTLVGHTGGVWSSQMEGNIIVSGSTDRTLKVWNSETGVCVHTLYGHTSTVRCMHLHKNRVVSGSRDATLRIWDIQTSECLHVLTGHVAAVRCVQYNGRLVVSGAYDYLVKVWNPDTEECLHTLSGHTNRVYSLQFDGIHVVSGSLDTSIRVWDVETGACKHALMGHQSLTSGMELRNNILVSGNADSTVKVWDITTGQCLQTLSGPNKHQSAVTCLQFNSKFVITSSDDGTVKLWDVKTGEFIRDLVALESGGSGGVVWRIRANATKLVCAVGSRNGTEETKLLVLDFEAGEAGGIVKQ